MATSYHAAPSFSEGLAGVHPAVAARARAIVQAFNGAGWPVVVTSGRRSHAAQRELIAQGLTAARNSRHLTGLAFDLSFAGLPREAALSQAWRPYFLQIGRYGEALGLRWGGRFKDYDPFHFDAG